MWNYEIGYREKISKYIVSSFELKNINFHLVPLENRVSD